jgi:hypothetical protein
MTKKDLPVCLCSNIKIANTCRSLENVAKFKYLGMTLTKAACKKKLTADGIQRMPNTIWSTIFSSHLLSKYINVIS